MVTFKVVNSLNTVSQNKPFNILSYLRWLQNIILYKHELYTVYTQCMNIERERIYDGLCVNMCER